MLSDWVQAERHLPHVQCRRRRDVLLRACPEFKRRRWAREERAMLERNAEARRALISQFVLQGLRASGHSAA